jgi:hypothetical protein
MGTVILTETAPVVAVDPKAPGRGVRPAYLLVVGLVTAVVVVARRRSGHREGIPGAPLTLGRDTAPVPLGATVSGDVDLPGDVTVPEGAIRAE